MTQLLPRMNEFKYRAIKKKYPEKIALQKINAEIDFYSSLVNATKLAGGSVDWIIEETTLKDE